MIYIVEWLGGPAEKYHSKSSQQKRVDDLVKSGFHKDWDFYSFEFEEDEP